MKVLRAIIALLGMLPLMHCAITHASSYNRAHVYYRDVMTAYLRDPGVYEAYWKESDPGRKKAMRNRIMDYCVYLSDDAFSSYEVKFSNGNSAVNLGFDLTSLATAGASTVAAAPKTLAAITTGLLGAKGAYSSDVLDQQTRSVITLKMETLRKRILTPIRAGEDAAVADYPLERGLIDIQNYVNAGTVHAALSDIARDVSKQ